MATNGTPTNDPEDAGSTLRRLPWTTGEGKLCFLSTAGPDSFLSRLADDLEEVQLDTAAEVLEHSLALLANPDAPPTELRFVTARLTECLGDALRVAESRGERMSAGALQ
ncbi:hypothetical protein [Streptomyces sp. TBY4]|uniref:hypothetical protein n=1 Tax=Streptomyces sp. TBY4 TaxID=2962030 RepID=UPI0020B69362|nr:hypothetical protein [Streptomyces sp. TBY4]MCP3756028.1 hypothetical protein [Streptomyces sp. TBY4]